MDAKAVALVGLGGALGAVARFGVSQWARDGFPWHTLAVNLAGSFLLGLLFLDTGESDARSFAAVGFLGAFTTLSTFSVETLTLWRGGAIGAAVCNVLANGIGGPLTALLGWWVRTVR